MSRAILSNVISQTGNPALCLNSESDVEDSFWITKVRREEILPVSWCLQGAEALFLSPKFSDVLEAK